MKRVCSSITQPLLELVNQTMNITAWVLLWVDMNHPNDAKGYLCPYSHPTSKQGKDALKQPLPAGLS